MSRRNDVDQELIEKGKLWETFNDTLWGHDLNLFFKDQELIGREAVCDLTIAGKYEEAKAAAHKVAGILAVKTYIDSCIGTMREVLGQEKEDREYKRSIPSHV